MYFSCFYKQARKSWILNKICPIKLFLFHLGQFISRMNCSNAIIFLGPCFLFFSFFFKLLPLLHPLSFRSLFIELCFLLHRAFTLCCCREQECVCSFHVSVIGAEVVDFVFSWRMGQESASGESFEDNKIVKLSKKRLFIFRISFLHWHASLWAFVQFVFLVFAFRIRKILWI